MRYWPLWLVLATATALFAQECGTGCVMVGGVCACDQVPETAPPVKPSDEKPPRSGMPSYQADGVHAVDAPSLIYNDAKQDQERADAETAGKHAAGLN